MTKEATIQELDVAHEQLARMRGMTRYYHERFFSDTRFITVSILALVLIGFWAVPEAFLLVPIVALLGANQTAFDASYLYFARHYAVELEREINSATKRTMLVASQLEDVYLFPLNKRKVVAIGLGSSFSWFGWVTVVYTALGLVAAVVGVVLGWSVLTEAGSAWTFAYLGGLGILTLASLAVGWWWFVAGTGEARLRSVLDNEFGRRGPRNNRSNRNGIVAS